MEWEHSSISFSWFRAPLVSRLGSKSSALRHWRFVLTSPPPSLSRRRWWKFSAERPSRRLHK
eukprot:3266188-Prymnesium_polylepis.1